MSSNGFHPTSRFHNIRSLFSMFSSDLAIDLLVRQFASCPSTMTAIILEYMHGAATRVPTEATAFPQRQPAWNMLILSQWRDAAESNRNIVWTKETYDAMLPFMSKRQYVNYLSDDQLTESISDVYGPNYERLRHVKRMYDPENVFHLNPDILDISVDTSSGTALKFSLSFTSSYVNSLPFELDLKKLVKLLGAGMHVYLWGPAGSGKTTAALMAARASSHLAGLKTDE